MIVRLRRLQVVEEDVTYKRTPYSVVYLPLLVGPAVTTSAVVETSTKQAQHPTACVEFRHRSLPLSKNLLTRAANSGSVGITLRRNAISSSGFLALLSVRLALVSKVVGTRTTLRGLSSPLNDLWYVRTYSLQMPSNCATESAYIFSCNLRRQATTEAQIQVTPRSVNAINLPFRAQCRKRARIRAGPSGGARSPRMKSVSSLHGLMK